MPWAAPRTWVTGELVTSTIMNAHVRDELVALRDSAPAVTVYRNSNLSLTNNTETVVTWSAAADDNDVMWAGGAPTRLTCKTAGLFLGTSGVWFAANATGQRYGYLRKNGSGGVGNAGIKSAIRGANAAAASTTLELPFFVQLAVNDYIELIVYQDSGGALNVIGVGVESTSLSLLRVGA